MFDGFRRAFDAFRQAGADDPLLETLRLFDVLAAGALRTADAVALPQESLDELAAKRVEGVPLEYILGKAVFMGLQLECSPGALIPRQETELLARTAIDLILARQASGAGLTVVDMGTGSGNIAVALAVHAPAVRVLACDVSPSAVELARRQAAKFGVQDRLSIFCGDLYEPLLAAGYRGKVDLVVCNPPYLPTSTLEKLARDIIDHEPVVALDAGPYGINVFRRLIAGAVDVLKPDGVLVFEIGAGQEKLVARLLEGSGVYPHVEYHRDAAGQVRVVSAGRRPACGCPVEHDRMLP
ncbi:MAG: peptide chain release factor N(5)-glutamine methyltransferase [Thermoguttaceae bacterium]